MQRLPQLQYVCYDLVLYEHSTSETQALTGWEMTVTQLLIVQQGEQGQVWPIPGQTLSLVKITILPLICRQAPVKPDI